VDFWGKALTSTNTLESSMLKVTVIHFTAHRTVC